MSRRQNQSTATTSAPTAGSALPAVAFVGRAAQLSTLAEALASTPLVVVTGAAGSGKTALARELMRSAAGAGAAYVHCAEGDLAEAVVARSERALDALPGSLARTLAAGNRLLILDELHRLTPEVAARLLAHLACAPGRLLAFSRDVLPLPPAGASRADLTLDGMIEPDARNLWAQLESNWGPAPGAFDEAFERTRGVPLAMRREYARARDKKAWEPASLPAADRKVLAAASVLRVPATHAALAELVPGVKIPEVLARLAAMQLIDVHPFTAAKIEVHDVVRGLALAALSTAERKALESGCAALFDDDARGDWEHVDGAGVAVSDPVDRLREGTLHLAAAGKLERAEARLQAARGLLSRRGGSGEALAIIARMALGGSRSRELDELRAELLAGAGRVAEARDAYEALTADSKKAAPEQRLALAELAVAAGEVTQVAALLEPVAEHIRPEIRARAALIGAQAALDRGDTAGARKALRGLDAGKHEAHVRAGARLLAALIDAHDGAPTALPGLGRVAASTELPLYAARAAGLIAAAHARSGRLEAAATDLEQAERMARGLDAPALGDELRAMTAQVELARGKAALASDMLRSLVRAARDRGAERAALGYELELTRALIARGRASEAGRLAQAVAQTAESRGLVPLAAAARLALAQIARAEYREGQARELLIPLTTLATASAETRTLAAAELAVITEGAAAPTLEHDELATRILGIEWNLAHGRRDVALAAAVETTALAAAAGRSAELASALTYQAMLHAGAGRADAADEAAVRAISEGVPGGLDRQVARSLVVRAAILRDAGSPEQGLELADAAHTIATAAGLSVESLVAAACAEACARQASDEQALIPLGARRRSAAATLATPARAAADAMLADLGLSSDRPFRVAASGGAVSYVATVDQDGLGVARRSFVVDGAREVVVREGATVADLRRRSLLKKLLFLFAGAPGRVFSKEDIVRRVWGVDYHPLRHDAALFTNVMRLRRVIGADGESLLRATEGGYKLVPPQDFLFIERVGA